MTTLRHRRNFQAEVWAYSKLRKLPGIPEFISSGIIDDHQYIVIERVSYTLQDVYHQNVSAQYIAIVAADLVSGV